MALFLLLCQKDNWRPECFLKELTSFKQKQSFTLGEGPTACGFYWESKRFLIPWDEWVPPHQAVLNIWEAGIALWLESRFEMATNGYSGNSFTSLFLVIDGLALVILFVKGISKQSLRKLHTFWVSWTSYLENSEKNLY